MHCVSFNRERFHISCFLSARVLFCVFVNRFSLCSESVLAGQILYSTVWTVSKWSRCGNTDAVFSGGSRKILLFLRKCVRENGELIEIICRSALTGVSLVWNDLRAILCQKWHIWLFMKSWTALNLNRSIGATSQRYTLWTRTLSKQSFVK